MAKLLDDLESCDTDETTDGFAGDPVTWEDAVSVLLKVEAVIAPLGAHTALTGSCIYKGGSSKDIDIVIYPHNCEEPVAKSVLLDALRKERLLQDINHQGMWYFQTSREYIDKDVVLVKIDGFRVDLFFFFH